MIDIDMPEFVSSIKQAAAFTGLSEDTIRYYEKIGLLPYADRKANGHRTYSRQQLIGMVFLTRLKATGMTLEEMKHYRKLYEEGAASIPQRVAILREHKERIRSEIDRLLETERIIDYKLDNYREVLLHPDLSNAACHPLPKE